MAKESMGREAWAKQIAAWRRSGRDATEFCQRRGLSRKTFSWWRWRLGVGAGGTAGAFVPVTAKAPSAPPGVTEFELVLHDVVVRVPAGFDVEALGRLVDALAARR